jgi:UDP-N-acetylmuramoylalanine--D-glutamate ligase
MELEGLGIAVRLGAALKLSSFEALNRPIERVIVSPGIRWDHPTLVELRQGGVAVGGELLAAWEALPATPWIGITGTNGKTTVTHLVNHLLTSAGLDAPMGGNVGNSAAELALERLAPGQTAPDWLVVELSSYQIEACAQVAPRIGLWTTLTPDHLERHGTLDHYRAIKRSLLERSACRILNADDPDLRAQAASWQGAQWVTAGERSALPPGLDPLLWIEGHQVTSSAGPLLDARSLAMPGAHNRQNLLLATAVGLELGISGATMEAAFRQFPGVPHRLERIAKHQGIPYYNDSKATNYDAAEVALQALPGPLVVLAGGQAKQGIPAVGSGSSSGKRRPWCCLAPPVPCSGPFAGRRLPRTGRRCRRHGAGRGRGPCPGPGPKPGGRAPGLPGGGAVASLRQLRSIQRFRSPGRPFPPIGAGPRDPAHP